MHRLTTEETYLAVGFALQRAVVLIRYASTYELKKKKKKVVNIIATKFYGSLLHHNYKCKILERFVRTELNLICVRGIIPQLDTEARKH